MDIKLHTRNSRWTRDPVMGRGGTARVICPIERDVEIFRLLVRHRYLPSNYIHAFVGGNEKALSHRLNLLSRKPNLYLTRPTQQRQRADANYRPLIYELDERGRRALRDRGIPVPVKKFRTNFVHDLMIAQIIASFELGVRENPSVRMISWSEIIASKNAPAALRDAPIPNAINVSYVFRGQSRTERIIADAEPFGLERVVDGKRSYLFFPGIEADCGSEPIDAGDSERSSIAKKFAAYLTIAEQGIHRAHFGFPNFFVPFITTTTTRMRSMMKLAQQLTSDAGSKILLFKTFPSFASPEQPAPPTGHMLTEPWQRVGCPPLALDR